MAIRVEHGKPSTIISAATKAGKAKAAQREREQAMAAAQRASQQAMANAARLQEQQMEMEYRNTLRQQDMAIDLQMQERAKLWEIDKMQLRSQIDFQREEQQRQRKLDSADNAIQQIDKEILAGRMTEQEAYPLKQKLELSKLGVNVPVSALPGDEEDRYGVDPYWMRGREAPEGTPERQLYEAKLAEGISGERKGVVPYYLDPAYMRKYPDAALAAQRARNIFLSTEVRKAMMEESVEDLNSRQFDTKPEGIDDTELEDIDDMKEKASPMGIPPGEVLVISPAGEEGTIPIEDLDDAIAEGYMMVSEIPQVTERKSMFPESLAPRTVNYGQFGGGF